MTLRAGSQPPSQMAAQARLLALWTRWLYNELVIPMVRAHFYCTESEAYRQQVLYFRLAPCTAMYRVKPSCNDLCTSVRSALCTAYFDATVCLSRPFECHNAVLVSASHLQSSTIPAHPSYEPCLYENPTETSSLLTPQLLPKQTHFGTWVMQVVYACQQLHNTQLTALQEARLGQAEDHSL